LVHKEKAGTRKGLEHKPKWSSICKLWYSN